MECRVWSVKYRVYNVECKVWDVNVRCKVMCKVWSVKCGV